MPLIKTTDLLTTLKTLITGLELSPGVALFDKVDFYSTTNIKAALQELYLFTDRICLIVPADNNYTNVQAGKALDTAVNRHVFILMSDRDFGRRQSASTGDVDTPGVIKINEIMEGALIGESLGFLNCRVMPVMGQAMILMDEQRDELTGREVWALELAIEAGDVRTTR